MKPKKDESITIKIEIEDDLGPSPIVPTIDLFPTTLLDWIWFLVLVILFLVIYVLCS